MLQVIAEIAKVAQEVAVSVEECKISVSVIEDMQSFIKEIGEISCDNLAFSEEEAVKIDFSKICDNRLEPRSTYFKEGHSYETDDRGRIYKMDGELIPGVEYSSNGGQYRVDPSGKVETLKEGYQSTYKERFDRTPTDGERGSWTGQRAESSFHPNKETEKGNKVAGKLTEYGLHGIDYQDALPDFEECVKESVEIDMTEHRYSNASEGIIGNFEKADTECVKKWNTDGKEGRMDWTARDVAKYRQDHNLTWHECTDKRTCQMIDRDIHDYFGHYGGVAECKRAIGQIIGGGFDA